MPTENPTVKAFRLKFVVDDDAQFEESNGEARAPLTAEEYVGNEYRACPRHPRSKVPTARVENGRAWCGECGTEYADIPYDEYLTYYGNPERHVYLGCIVDKQCACCNAWTQASSLWSIDLMDDDPAFRVVPTDKWFTVDAALALPGYFGEVAREVLDEAGYDAS